MQVGIHIDNYRLENRSVDYSLDSIAKIGSKITELNMIQGFDLFEGLGFSPYVSTYDDPLEIREKLEKRGLTVSCLDADYPIWSYRCIEFLRMSVLFASHLGVDAIATTDSAKLPAGMSEEEGFAIMKYHLGEVLKFAERHKVNICIEPHGQLTNNPESLLRLANCYDSEYLKINYDTGNVFIAGWDVPEFLEKIIDKVHHCHIKDVAAELVSEQQGGETGIASSDVSVGKGVNAENIIACLKIFKKHGFKGVLSVECGGEVLSESSFKWLSQQVGALA